MLRIVRVSKSSTDEDLVETCKRELQCYSCQIESGPQKETITPTDLPENTVAVIIDISDAGGALYVHKKADNDFGNVFIDMVGSGDSVENVLNLVIVPWKAEWFYRSLGAIRLKYVIKR